MPEDEERAISLAIDPRAHRPHIAGVNFDHGRVVDRKAPTEAHLWSDAAPTGKGRRREPLAGEYLSQGRFRRGELLVLPGGAGSINDLLYVPDGRRDAVTCGIERRQQAHM